jgi:hypothetical protein
VLLELYAFLLRLYPQQFRQDFAAEMQTVFADALRFARQEGRWAVLCLCGRELRQLPRALAREHWQSDQEKGVSMGKKIHFMADRDGAGPEPRETSARGWWEIIMAMLPFVLILVADVLPRLLVEWRLLTWDSNGMQVVNIALAVLMIGAFLGTFFLAWRRKWPAWSASWYLFFAAAPLMLVIWLSFLLRDRLNIVLNQNLAVSLGSLLALAVLLFLAALLYRVTYCAPLRGLLAVMPVLYWLWLSNMEFVPNSIQIAIKIPSVALICLTIAFLLRWGKWRTGLFAILAMNLGVGVLFSYAGIYHGGSLPFVAPGPNLTEVARSLVPQYLAMSAILLGPLFARKIRQIGRSGGRAGEVGYHLALAGLLLVILANLAGVALLPPSGRISASIRTAQTIGILLGLGAYLVGLFLLYSDTPFGRTAPEWVWRLLLVLLPLAIPVTFVLPFITDKWPLSDLYGIPLLWRVPHSVSLSIGLVWLGLSVWVVTQGLEAPRSTLAVRGASDAASVS